MARTRRGGALGRRAPAARALAAWASAAGFGLAAWGLGTEAPRRLTVLAIVGEAPLPSANRSTPADSSGGAGHLPLMPAGRFPRRPFRPIGIRVGAIIPSQVIDPHGEQDGTVNQEITLGRGDAAPVSLLAEQPAHVLKCLVNGKNGKHDYHLHLRCTAAGA